MQERCREGRIVTQLVTLRGKLRPSKRFSCRTVINMDLILKFTRQPGGQSDIV